MSTLYLATDVEPLAERLARHLDQLARTGDFFEPTTIVVPHRALGQWLRLWLARRRGIAMNLRVVYLEAFLWDMLRAVDPRPQDPPPELLDGDRYRLLVLHVLRAGTGDAGLDYWQRMLQAGATNSRLHGRRLWRLADQLSNLIRDYEYHRQDALIQHWLLGNLGLDPSHRQLERAQQAVFRAITHIPDGLRAILNESWGCNFKTLPQYAMEVMEQFSRRAESVPRVAHLFGLTQMSNLHARTLHWLGRFFDLRVYYLNVLAGRLGETPDRSALIRLAQEIRANEPSLALRVGEVSRANEPAAQARDGTSAQSSHARAAGSPEPGRDLLHAWGGAGAESLETMAELCDDPKGFAVERVGGQAGAEWPLFGRARRDSVLSRLQDQLTGVDTPSDRLPQDRSLQILGCPGMVREVETVYHGILANLHRQPDLKQSDVAVLATDMELYRPIIQAVFERHDRRLRYNLGDFSAAGVSIFGQALTGMLDLALDSFTRSGVLAVLLNPCFLSRLGVSRSDALVWLDWVQALGIYQSWDQGDKKERGYADTPYFAWQLGLRRLRLGRIMETGREEQSELAPRFGPVVPYADLHSGDPEQLNSFCVAVDRLLPRLAQLRRLQGNAARWIAELESLIRDFLEVPAERPEEAQVRDRLLAAMQQWLVCDHLENAATGETPVPSAEGLSLPLVREMVVSSLEGIEGMRGQYATGGVTVAALQPLKPMPFRIVYVLGLGEATFPGSNVLSGLDLRGLQPQPGDIRPADFNRYLYLETLLAVRDKVYLLYNNLDIQKDQILHPAVPLQQLKRYLHEHVIEREFEETKIPLLPNDESYLRAAESSTCDALANFDESDRLLAVLAAERDGGLILSPEQQDELARKVRQRQAEFSVAASQPAVADVGSARKQGRPATIRLRDLSRYLEFPVPAAVKYHLRLQDEEQEELPDDEPFVSDLETASGLIRQTLNWMVLRSVQAGVEQALGEWRQRFADLYQEWSLRGRVPEETFGQVDQAGLLEDLEKRIKSVAEFLASRPADTYCGPILLGESVEPIGARERFEALRVPLMRKLPRQPLGEARLVGLTRHVWRTAQSEGGRVDVLIWCLQNQAAVNKEMMHYFFEPGLLFLALSARNQESGARGPGTAGYESWLGKRSFNMHVAHAGEVSSFGYPFGFVNSDQARAYLSELTTDFLDPHCLDLLPLRKILERKDLYRAIVQPAQQLGSLPAEYATLLEECLADDAESGTIWNRWSTPLVDLVGAQVPADAFAKVQRRFWLFRFFE